MAIVKEGVLRSAVVTLWALISLSYLCLLQVGGSKLTGLEAFFVSALTIVGGAFAGNACERLLKIQQNPGNRKEWWGLAYEMLKVPTFLNSVSMIGLIGFLISGNVGVCIAVGALFVGLWGFLYLLSGAYKKIYSFTDSNAS